MEQNAAVREVSPWGATMVNLSLVLQLLQLYDEQRFKALNWAVVLGQRKA